MQKLKADSGLRRQASPAAKADTRCLKPDAGVSVLLLHSDFLLLTSARATLFSCLTQTPPTLLISAMRIPSGCSRRLPCGLPNFRNPWAKRALTKRSRPASGARARSSLIWRIAIWRSDFGIVKRLRWTITRFSPLIKTCGLRLTPRTALSRRWRHSRPCGTGTCRSFAH